MSFITISNLLILNGILFGLLFCLFIYLLIFKVVELRKEKNKQMLMEELDPLFLDFVVSGVNQPDFSQVDERIIEDVLSKYLTFFKQGDQVERIQHLASELLSDFYKDKLEHRRLSVRLNALYQLENFHLITFQEQLEGKLKKEAYENAEEKFQLARVLSTFQSELLFQYLIFHGKEPIPKFIYKEILYRFDASISVKFLDYYDQLPEAFQKAVMEWLGETNTIQHLPFVESKLSNDKVEVRISALKAIASIGYVSDVDQLIPFAESKVEPERILFARIAKKLQRERLKKYIVELTSDPSWFVRQAAGEAIASYPDANILFLYILENTTDPFAKDLALQWVEEVGDNG
ncbi:hypothetical protein KO561_06245 [Radiobacillus kanasensis]|uniref:HEAT repeat domain-containing protein n=1 Tax=Radiobacillus kanasensis TaxID=2844358 RepID=UPI001E46DF08|nr:hypothetical protein [Radiobacillus kanasensis]UFU00539.1 hypothetical protein KO561_06245 [Radiobacillus kanasensis]